MGNGLWEMNKWEMGVGWLPWVSRLWDRKLWGKEEFRRERRIVNLQVACSIIYRL